MNTLLLSEEDLGELFRRHQGDPRNHGWRVRMHYKFGYFSTDEWYQGVVDRLVTANSRWIDVGGGKSVFPGNRRLSRELADRCALLVGADPSDNLEQNEFVHERVKSTIEDMRSTETFDLATVRMVAEHIEKPELVVQSLARLIEPGGHVVIYTPNRWAPASIVAALVPNKWHHYFTRLLWSTKKEDVFGTFYRMNTRKRLRVLFETGAFKEVAFAYLDNCAVLQRFRPTCFFELSVWWMFRKLGITYPENDLIGVYQKMD